MKVVGSFVIVRTCLLGVYQNTQSTVIYHNPEGVYSPSDYGNSAEGILR